MTRLLALNITKHSILLQSVSNTPAVHYCSCKNINTKFHIYNLENTWSIKILNGTGQSKLSKVLDHTRTYSNITTNESTNSIHIKSHLSSTSHYLSSHHILQVTVSAHTFNVLYYHNSNPLFLYSYLAITKCHCMLLSLVHNSHLVRIFRRSILMTPRTF